MELKVAINHRLDIILFFIVLNAAYGLAFDVHIMNTEEQGYVVFNASMGPDWTYSIFRPRKSSLSAQVMRADATTGHISLQRTPITCTQLKHNPFTIYIESRSKFTISGLSENVTLTPLTVYVHGEKCRFQRTRNMVKNAKRLQRMSVNMAFNSGTCLGAETALLSVQDFIPNTLRKCHIGARVLKPKHFQVEPEMGYLRTTKKVCMRKSHLVVNGVFQTVCGASNLFEIPFKILIFGKDATIHRFVLVDDLVRDLYMHHRTRLRRSVGNTAPSFAETWYTKNVPEEQNPGYVISTITATDPDSGDAGSLTYTLLATRDGRSQNLFAIDPGSGRLTTTQRLDRESIATHYFQIIATDNGTPKRSGIAQLTIRVTDVNDHTPRFESSAYSRSVQESLSVGATVLTVRASDNDFGPNADIKYSILNPSGPNEVFHIDSRTGSIITRRRLDRESKNFYKLEIQATDQGPPTDRKSATSVVEITVLDENDNKPQFTQNSYTFEVAEDINPTGNPVIGQIKATDKDQGTNAMVRYSITGGNAQGAFAINSLTGQLSVLIPLNYESVQNYRLSIRAQDSGSPPKSNSTTALIRVKDVNDNSPSFYANMFQESVLESVPIGYSIMRVQAYDSDSGLNSALVYTLKNIPPNMPIVIDRNTGWLSTNGDLDRESAHLFRFNVEARDQGTPPRFATATIEVTIRDVNDNAPIFNPRVYNEVVSEEAIPGTPVVTVTAKDKDEKENGRVTYRITSGNVRNAFNIISQMGQGLISVARALNYKEQSRFILTVTASDPHNKIDTATVFINVSDANTYRPIFQGVPYQLRLNEDTAVGSSVFKVLATDGDVGENARITYTMISNPVFKINSVTGEISIKQPLDRETVAGYTLSVTASDHGRPVKSDTTDVEVIVNDVNDNSPEFLKPSYTGRVTEDAVVGTSILQISAKDKDEGLNGRIRYTFEGGNNGGGDFMMDPTLGILRVAKELDRERVARYELRAFAIDRGATERSTSVVINIQVEDINDNYPKFKSEELTLSIKENSPIGSTVDTILAVDPDEGVNAEVEYSIVGGPDADSFGLNSAKSFRLNTKPNEPAVLITKVELDYESGKKSYSIVIRAQSFNLFRDAKITINVIDVNDNMPQMKDFAVIFNNFKNHFPTGLIGKIPAWDPDVNDKLTYKFLAGNEARILHLGNSTGLIRLDSRLNSDVPTNATLQVSVFDGINEVKATCKLFVRLVTEDMLFNSITVRLNDIDQTAFLSPLYHLFVSALAHIIPTGEENIYIINIQDDTDVHAKILNVSFSVRQKTENNKDVFYSPQFLKERVYLQRLLLAKLSTLQVLPFDDNLCVREPCLNYEECHSVLAFGNASSFISSPTTLFRPIRPINGVHCGCPKGFTGMTSEYLCDTEVNLCYSNPCGGNGTCIRREGGYTCRCNEGFAGDHCQFDMRNNKYKSCPSNICKKPSQCAPLIRGGFRCELCQKGDSNRFCKDCSNVAHMNRFCELTTRSFPKGSFLMYPSLKRRHRFEIKMKFATRQKNALLIYNGRYNEMHDFIALEIVNGQVQFSFSLGTNITTVRAQVQGGVHNGDWHQVTVTYLNRTVTLTVGEWCDTQVAVQYGKHIGNYTCAARTTKVLEARCADVTAVCHRFLDLTGPFQIGGLPSLPSAFQVHNKHFVGCMRDFYIDSKYLDLNDFVWNNGTVKGCQQKKMFCQSSPCKNNGACKEAWGTYQCDCPTGYGGKDCSQVIEKPRRLRGDGYLLYSNHGLPLIQLPWYNAISFRTRHAVGLLLYIEAGIAAKVSIEIINGHIYYIYPRKTVVLDDVLVNDGQWHYLETRWLTNKLIITLDYGQIQKTVPMGDWVVGKTIGNILVGGLQQQVGNTFIVRKGLKGCVKDIRVGNNANTILKKPIEHHVDPGCASPDPCKSSPCPATGYCNDEWGKHSCSCQSGYIGSKCDNICKMWNPCQHGSQCKRSASSSHGYMCQCVEPYSGQYCENAIEQPCPSTWWGFPVCGPCNCPTKKGFNPKCNRKNGQCVCKDNHYRPKGNDTCYPCDCYATGSYGRSCDSESGQCRCRKGVIGRRCDICSNRFAEVTIRGCEVIYDSCPQAFAKNILWKRTLFGKLAKQPCPKGALGNATRNCTDNGWGEASLFDCMSTQFKDLKQQVELIEKEKLQMNTFLAKSLMSKLESATNASTNLYGIDINITYRITKQILIHETKQAGLNLTHTQDRNFIQNLVNALGRILEPKYKESWHMLNVEWSASADILELMDLYTRVLAQNTPQLFTQPFDSVHSNMVLGLDYIEKDNFSSVNIPKYNNKVQNPGMFDKETAATIPRKILKEISMKDSVLQLAQGKRPKAVVGYAMFKHLGDLMPPAYGESVRVTAGVPISVNAPLFVLNLVDGNKTVKGELKTPVSLKFKQTQTFNRTGPRCVIWRGGVKGHWSDEGCQLVERVVIGEEKFVTCQCSHLSSFAILMDVSSIEHAEARALGMEIVTYAALSISLICLIAAFFLFCVLRGLWSNANSIHINLVFTIFVAHLMFLIGINRTEPKLMCRIVAIFLHYFFMCTFAWMFVEALHLYRQMTEIRNINQGSMKFYYLIGYVIPGIIVGLAVGLDTGGYGNQSFCWVRTTDMLIWSFAGPICLLLLLNLIVFIMALVASCKKSKEADTDFSPLRTGLKAAVVLLPLLGVTWVFALLAVNDNILAFHYLFAFLTLCQGLFIFLAHVVFNKQVRREIKHTWYKIQGKKGFDDSFSGNRSSRSALAYHHNESLDGGLNRMNVGISTTSTTSHSTSKSSQGLYRADGYIRSTSTSTSGNVPSASDYPPNTGIPPYGYEASMFHDIKPGDPDTGEHVRKRNRDSDSDSELSAMENPDMELASSHSSDEDEDEDRWDVPKGKSSAKHKPRGPPPVPEKPTVSGRSVHPTAPPPPYTLYAPRSHWPGEGLSTTTCSDTDIKSPDQIKISQYRSNTDRHLGKLDSIKGSKDALSPPERTDSLPPKSDSGQVPASSGKLPQDRIAVQVLTHNGSVSSDSESSHSDTEENWA